jgi:exopolyphosphatase/guanosine-5'-triphosphate,3'-diphosphate pyrophosphatase
LAIGERDVDAWVSLDIGSVRLTERCVRRDPPDMADLANIAAVADRVLTEGASNIRPQRARTLVGLAGTITTMVAIEKGLAGYDRDAIHHATLTDAEVDKLIAHLASMTSAERRKLPAMPRGREDVIVAGAVILQRVMRRFGFSQVLISESDILDGLAGSIVRAGA